MLTIRYEANEPRTTLYTLKLTMQCVGLICESRETKGWNLADQNTHAVILYDSMSAECLVKVAK